MSANRFRFRAWHNYEGMTHDVVMGSKGFTATWKGQGGLRIGQEFDAKNTDAILMQSTGLLDRNQKEIFEGDICVFGPRIIPHIYEILWDKTRWLGKNSKELIDLLLLQKQSFDLASEYYCEVVGNIYENPELLNHFRYKELSIAVDVVLSDKDRRLFK